MGKGESESFHTDNDKGSSIDFFLVSQVDETEKEQLSEILSAASGIRPDRMREESFFKVELISRPRRRSMELTILLPGFPG